MHDGESPDQLDEGDSPRVGASHTAKRDQAHGHGVGASR